MGVAKDLLKVVMHSFTSPKGALRKPVDYRNPGTSIEDRMRAGS